MSNQIRKYDLTGKTFIPVGFARNMVENGLLGYDARRADGTLTSALVTKFMLAEKYDPYRVILFENGKTKEVTLNLDTTIELVIGPRFVGLLGWDISNEQNLATLRKLTYKCGFFDLVHEGIRA